MGMLFHALLAAAIGPFTHLLAGLLIAGVSACAPMPKPQPLPPGITRSAIAPPDHDSSPPLAYLTAGDPAAPRLIYVHGTPGDAAAFTNYLRAPIPGHESISIDRPGFGDSRSPRDRRPAVPAFADQARAIAPLLVERQGRWPILIGHSLGGPIIARVAADSPDRVGGLVILAGSLDPDLEEWKWYNRVADLPFVKPLLPRDLRTSNDEVRAARDETALLAPLLGRITCPVVIVHGTRDSLVPVANVDYMRAMLTNAASVEVILLEGQDHFIPWSAEPTVREAIQRAIGLSAQRQP